MIPRHTTHPSTEKTAANPRHHSYHSFHGTSCMCAYVRVLMSFLLFLSRIYISPWNAWYQWNTGFIGKKSVKTAVESQWNPENVS